MTAPFEAAIVGIAPRQIPRWGMVIDLNRCVGCQTCTAACKHAHDAPPGVQWRRVLDVEFGTFPDVERLFLPVGCQHCEAPPCVPVCPTGATYKRLDGIVAIDYDRCIGCASCAVACPYEARSLVSTRALYFGDRDTVQEQAVAHPERIGVAQKCTFCIGKIDAGIARNRRPGEDLDATPACAVSCIADAIKFGDFNDPASEVSRLVRRHRSFALNVELGTGPMIRYLYETPVVPGREPAPADFGDERLADAENPLVGSRQRWWDMRAAMNFILGGLGSGLAVIAALADLVLDIPEEVLLYAFVVAGAVVALGLTSVFFKIGRKTRFLYVLRRPQTSWMSREVYVVVGFYAALGAYFVWPDPALAAIVAGLALAFVVCQARILFAAKGIPAWRAPLVPWLVIVSGLQEGGGALFLVMAALGESLREWSALALLGLILAVVNAALWHNYVTSARGRGFSPRARTALGAAAPWIHLIAHGVPGLLCAAALVVPLLPPGILVGIAAGAAILGGAIWKNTVIVGAGYFNGLSLPRLPRRGSGMRAAPVGLAAPARSVTALQEG
jgi:phenylacetyl-CoA:acceptor oxidoreductase subunit 1